MRRSRPISLGSIRGFEATARLLNFSAAADELSLTQSAISRQIQNLESEIGQPLFIRNARTIELTVHGQQLFNTIRQFLHPIDQTVHNIRTGADRRALPVDIRTCARKPRQGLRRGRLHEFPDTWPGHDERAAKRVRQQLIEPHPEQDHG